MSNPESAIQLLRKHPHGFAKRCVMCGHVAEDGVYAVGIAIPQDGYDDYKFICQRCMIRLTLKLVEENTI